MGWPYWGYGSWYGGSGWYGYYDWRWWNQQRTWQIHEQRVSHMRNERAAIAHLSRSDARLNTTRAVPQQLLSGFDGARQRGDRDGAADPVEPLPTRAVEGATADPYYGLPRNTRRPLATPSASAELVPTRTARTPRRDDWGSTPGRAPTRQDAHVRSRQPAIRRDASVRVRPAPAFTVPALLPSVRDAPALRSHNRGNDRR